MQRYTLPQSSREFYRRNEPYKDTTSRYGGIVEAGSATTPLLPGGTFGANMSISQTRHQLQHQQRQQYRGRSGSGSSLPVVEAAENCREKSQYALQLLAYRTIYVLQGAFMGMLGPALIFFSTLAQQQSGLAAPVYGFGPIFAAHGGAALVTSFVSDFVLTYFKEKEFMKPLIVVLLLCSSAWYACLAPVAAATGNLGVGILFISKGCWTALLNISLNRCSLWIAGEKDQRRRSIVTSMNIYYGHGCLLGAVIALILTELDSDLSYAFFGLAMTTMVPAVMIAILPCPRSYYGREEHQTLLTFEDPSRRVPTVPSPIVGGVFLHAKHISGSKNFNPDTYDSKNNFIILLVTIYATVLFGIQLGLAAFLYDYVGTVLTEGKTMAAPLEGSDTEATTESNEAVWQCAAMVLFWGSLTLSYVVLPRFLFHDKNLYSIVVCAVVCGTSSFGFLFGSQVGVIPLAIFLFLFSVGLAPLFTLSIHCMTRVINEQLIRRVSSLIVFGCGMGEVFIPVLMGFFMSGQSGQANGAIAVSYITFILAITLVSVSGVLLWMVKARLKELPEPVDELVGNSEIGRMRAARAAGLGTHKISHY